jgi:Mycoplasma protein of unknown function, DUF285
MGCYQSNECANYFFSSFVISSWFVFQVTDFGNTFSEEFAINQNIAKWFVSKVASMSSMFSCARFFNQVVSLWDITKVGIFALIFGSAIAFYHNLCAWRDHITGFLCYFVMMLINSCRCCINSLSVGSIIIPNCSFECPMLL